MLTRVYTFSVVDGQIKSDILLFATDDVDDICDTIRAKYPLVQQIVYDASGSAIIYRIR